MTSPCSSTTTNFAVYKLNASLQWWEAVCEVCSDGYHPPNTSGWPNGTYDGEERAAPCDPDGP